METEQDKNQFLILRVLEHKKGNQYITKVYALSPKADFALPADNVLEIKLLGITYNHRQLVGRLIKVTPKYVEDQEAKFWVGTVETFFDEDDSHWFVVFSR